VSENMQTTKPSEKPHKKLIVWQKAIVFIETTYEITRKFPDDERFGLVTQMRRSAVSVASNIAEGAARQTWKETLQLWYVARGSISELDTQIEIAGRLRFITAAQRNALIDDLNEVGRLLNGLMTSRARAPRPSHSLLTHSPTH
jgi:four helix bundle protein